jgi:hypothetical protein
MPLVTLFCVSGGFICAKGTNMPTVTKHAGMTFLNSQIGNSQMTDVPDIREYPF